MKLIVGLGNPGAKYLKNRHNLGFMVVDKLVGELGSSWSKSPDLMSYFVKQSDFVFLKPTTFMNQSGQAVLAAVNFFKIDKSDILTVYDDLDLDFGKIRLAFNGSSAGHRGVESVISGLGSIDFGRLRVGIGSPRKSPKANLAFSGLGEAGRPTNPKQDPADFVLEDFTDEEKSKLPEILKKCQEAVRSYLDDGIEATMNRFN